METFVWKAGTQTTPAKVTIGSTTYDVTDAEYSGETPLTPENLNQMQTIINGNITDNLSTKLDTTAIKLREYSKEITMTSNIMYSFEMGKLNTPSGYTFIGCIAKDNGYGDQWLISYANYGDGIYAMVHSNFTGSLTQTIKCYAVFIETNALANMLLS